MAQVRRKLYPTFPRPRPREPVLRDMDDRRRVKLDLDPTSVSEISDQVRIVEPIERHLLDGTG